MASDRSFGFTFAILFSALGLWHLRIGWLAAGAIVLLITLIQPSALAPSNRVWTRFGELLNRIVSPLVSALVFFVAVTPTALILRWKGKDPLRLKLEPAAPSYWIPREPPGPAPESMIRQF